jgi:ribosome maturation factor RimP
MAREESMKLDATIERQLGEMVIDEGLTLLSTEVVGTGPKTVLRLVVDGPEGVTLDQCASVSRQASAMLDVEDPINHAYTLEVSSPGLDRKLYSEDDYRQFSGHQIKIRMDPSYRDHRVVHGELVGLDGPSVVVRTADGQRLAVPFDRVFEARLEVDWKDVLRKGKNRP